MTTATTFNSFGDLLKYLRRRERLTQLELSIAVGYSEAQISRLEQNQRRPDLTALKALFIPVLHLEDDPEIMARFLELAESTRQEDAPTPGYAPYKGLLFFDESDSDLFFGREALTAHLAERITGLASDATTRFLAIVGASGSGKSSLVRAGLAMTLKRSGWNVRVFNPTASPLRMLESQLNSNHMPSNADATLLLVDQFEELFTLCRDESERIAFIEKLLLLATLTPASSSLTRKEATNNTIVIALRADFYSHCAQYPLLRQAVAAQQEYIGQMTTTELRRAIEEPAKRGGWDMEPGLVDLLLNDIGAQGTSGPEPGALPLLSHALLATWERRRGKLFTIKGYRASGGVRGAIAETAESVFTDQLNQEQQNLARDVFLRLTELGEGTEDTRRRAALNELVRQAGEATQLRAVLNTLAEARLITLNEDSAEVAHEALIREWQRLHEWLTADREGLRLHRHLTESAHEWEARGQDPGDLYRGARLAQAREWAQSNLERLNASERAFLQASVEREARDALDREALRQRELDSAKRLFEAEKQATGRMKRVSILLAIALTVSLILAGFVLRLNHITGSRELAAAAVNQLSIDPELSILLALEALSKAHTREAQDALHAAVMASRIELRLQMTGEVFHVAYSPDGRQVIAAGAEGIAKVWDLQNGVEVFALRGHTAAIRQALFSPNGNVIATASEDNTVKLWNANTGELFLTLSGHTAAVDGVAFSPDGRLLASASEDTSWKIWEVETGELVLSAPSRENDRVHMTGIEFSNNGHYIATTSWDGIVEVWNATTGNHISTLFNTEPEPIFGLDIDPSENLLASTSASDIRLSDILTGEVLAIFSGHTNLVHGVTFSPDGAQLASCGLDGKIKLWDVATGISTLTLTGHRSAVNAVAFSPNGMHVATASSDGNVLIWNTGPAREAYTIKTSGAFNHIAISQDEKWMAEGVGLDAKVWDVTTGTELFSFQHEAAVGAMAFTPDGQHLITTTEANEIRVWKIEDQTTVLKILSGKAFLNAVTISPDGTQIASAGEDGIVRVWNFSSGKLLFAMNGHLAPVTSLAYNPNGHQLASASVDNQVIIWNAETGDKVDVLNGHTDVVWSVAFSEDGNELVTASRDSTTRIWRVDSSEELRVFRGHIGTVVSAVFSPDGKQIASAGRDGITKVWDANTGELLLSIPGDGSGMGKVKFINAGTRLITTSENGIQMYIVELNDLIALAKTRLTRALTLDECQDYLHSETCPAE